MAEARGIGRQAFLNEYANGRWPVSKYVLKDGQHYPLKALFTASHTPPARHRHFSYKQAQLGLSFLGYQVVGLTKTRPLALVAGQGDYGAWEGTRARREISFLVRNRTVVAKAKEAHDPLICQVCEVDFGKRYGAHGRGFIEAHHIKPLHHSDGVAKKVAIKDFAMLCANCHRMAHFGQKMLTIPQLREIYNSRE